MKKALNLYTSCGCFAVIPYSEITVVSRKAEGSKDRRIMNTVNNMSITEDDPGFEKQAAGIDAFLAETAGEWITLTASEDGVEKDTWFLEVRKDALLGYHYSCSDSFIKVVLKGEFGIKINTVKASPENQALIDYFNETFDVVMTPPLEERVLQKPKAMLSQLGLKAETAGMIEEIQKILGRDVDGEGDEEDELKDVVLN